MFFKCLIRGINELKFDRLASFDLFLTTVYKGTHQAHRLWTTKITISIIDEYHGHAFWVLKRTVSSKHFFWMPKTQFYDWGKTTKTLVWMLSETVLLNTQIVCFHWNKREFRSLKSTQRQATNGLPAICHLNGLSEVGRWWPDAVC